MSRSHWFSTAAALLIQHSTCIYSRKVEYLRSLVYQALEFVSSKKEKESGGTAGDEANAYDDEDGLEDEDAAFLLLDDAVEEAGRDIDLEPAQTQEEENVMDESGSLLLPHAALLSLDDGGQTDDVTTYKMATCAVHCSGALLLDHAEGSGLDVRLRARPPRESGGVAGRAAGPRPKVEEEAEPGEASGRGEPLQGQEAPETDFGGAYDSWDGLDAGFDPGPDPAGVDERPDAARPEAQRLGRGAALQSHVLETPQRLTPEQPEYIDPDCAEPGQDRPLQRSTRVRTEPKDRRETYAPPLLWAEVSAAWAPPDKGLVFAEFAGLLARGAKAARRAAGKRGAGAAEAAPCPDGEGQTGAWDGLEGAWEGGADAWDAAAASDGEGAEGYETIEPLFHEAVDFPDTMPDPGPAEAQASALTYEDLCAAHWRAHVAAAAAAQRQTALQLAVQTWRERVEPVLAAEDARPAFDVHAYGRGVLRRLDDAEGVGEVGFGAALGSREAAEVARTFAAVLQLANLGNVEVCKRGQEDFGLRLLHAQLLHEDRGAELAAARGERDEQESEERRSPLRELNAERAPGKPALAASGKPALAASGKPALAAPGKRRRRAGAA